MGLVTDRPGLLLWVLGALYWPDVDLIRESKWKSVHQQENESFQPSSSNYYITLMNYAMQLPMQRRCRQ